MSSLANDVLQYFARAAKQPWIPLYPLEQEGVYELMGTSMSDRGGDQLSMGLYSGRFVDAVAELVSSRKYFGVWPVPDGYVIAAAEPKVTGLSPVPGLLETLLENKRYQEYESTARSNRASLGLLNLQEG